MARASLLAFMALLTVSASLAPGQLDDLERILERDRIALQKLQDEVQKALTESRTLQRTDPAKAGEILQDAVARVKGAADLPVEDRARLLQRLQVRQREVTAFAQVQRQAETTTAPRRTADGPRGRDDIPASQSKPVPSEGPAAVAGKIIESRAAQINNVNQLKNDRALQSETTLQNLNRSAVPPRGDIEYPKNWAQISERGKPKLTEREVALLRALNSVMSVNYDKTRLREVIDDIQTRAGMTILIDEQSLKDAAVEYDDPVTFKASKIGVRTILKKVLADRNLSFVIKEGMLHVVTQQKARETMVVRAYPISELLGNENRQIWGPLWKRAFELQHAQTIVNMIETSVEPSLWNKNGGPGSVSYHEPSQALIIRAPAELHYMINGQLR
jgi:hypothetical protein